jgi:hypothetical protein
MMEKLLEYWVAPTVKLASSCEHLAVRHRFVVLNLIGLVSDMGIGPNSVVYLGGIKVGKYGLVLMGNAAIDIHAVNRNVLWEDEHCTMCCGALLRYTEGFVEGKVLTRCGPTIGGTIDSDEARRLTDEYWTD